MARRAYRIVILTAIVLLGMALGFAAARSINTDSANAAPGSLETRVALLERRSLALRTDMFYVMQDVGRFCLNFDQIPFTDNPGDEGLSRWLRQLGRDCPLEHRPSTRWRIP